MKILHLYKDYHPILGGIENHIKMLAEAQAAAGHDVKVLVTNPKKLARKEMIKGVQVVRVHRLATIASTPLTAGFLPALARSAPDITHLHFPYPVGELSQLIIDEIFGFTGRGRPYVITYHSDIVRSSQQKFLRYYQPLLVKVLKAAQRILVTSQKYAETSPYLLPLAARCALAPLGIDPRPFENAAPLFPRSERPVLLFLGRHRYYKGVDGLIRAMSEIDAQLLIGGDGPMRAEWERLTDNLNLSGRVRFLGDIAAENLPGLYASADLFVLPATLRAEAFGTVLLEAMAAGLACVTTELGSGTSYVVQNGVTGLVVPPNDPSALVQAISHLLENTSLRAQMGAAGRERVRREFTLERMVDRVMSIYATVLEERTRGENLPATH